MEVAYSVTGKNTPRPLERITLMIFRLTCRGSLPRIILSGSLVSFATLGQKRKTGVYPSIMHLYFRKSKVCFALPESSMWCKSIPMLLA